jgi:general secretion pathway protein A
MYREYFGLEELPFSIAPDPRFLYLSEQHREALAHLVYGMKSGGFVLLTGEVGTGKTTVCRCLLDQVPENTEIAFVLNPKVTVEELLATICDELGIGYPADTKSIKVFVDLLNAYLLDTHAKGRKTVLIIDEAQNLSADVLEQLRLLTNLETNQFKLLQIILLGQPELRHKLSRPELRQLAQRITARYHLGPLSRKDVEAYVTHRLSVAGLKTQLFSPSSMDKLYQLSGGVPRLINVLCDRSLLGAFVKGQSSVSTSLLKKAAREVFGKVKNKGQQVRLLRWAYALLVLMVFAAVLIPSYINYSNHDSNLGAVHRTELPRSETLAWPDDQPLNRSRFMAFQALFRLWNHTYQHQENGTACQYAQENGLRCLHKLGSVGSLRFTNRPAILQLYNDKNREFFATLTSLSDNTATFVIGTDTKTVPLKDLESRWRGSYILLWKTPPEFSGNIQQGESGGVVQWLERQLAQIHSRPEQEGENIVFDDTMVKEVKKFQFAQNLAPDGIVGAQTIIRLNTSTKSDVPTLTSGYGVH